MMVLENDLMDALDEIQPQNASVEAESIDSADWCGCTGSCGQSCSGGCASGCTGDCGRSCSGRCS